ncbi:MAG: hypothetical protein GY870_19715, partial [archaeon]|nr:hypothetical protein [archaeon]
MLSTRRRFAIFLVYTIATAMAVGLLILPEVLNSDINSRDPVYFDRPLTSLYEYNNGTDTMDLNFNVIDAKSTESNCSILFDEVVQGYMNYTTDGTFVDNGVITTNMSLFWIHIVTEEGRSGLANIVGTTYQIYDLIGII